MEKILKWLRDLRFSLLSPKRYSAHITLFPQKDIGPEDLAVWTVEGRPPVREVEEGMGPLLGVVRLRPADLTKTGKLRFELMAGLGFKETAELVAMALKACERYPELYFLSVDPMGNPLLLDILEAEGFRHDPARAERVILALPLHTLFSLFLSLAVWMPVGQFLGSLKAGTALGSILAILYSQVYRRLRRKWAWEKRKKG